jgi:hypothetical protein
LEQEPDKRGKRQKDREPTACQRARMKAAIENQCWTSAEASPARRRGSLFAHHIDRDADIS